jgi:hypothetical protein
MPRNAPLMLPEPCIISSYAESSAGEYSCELSKKLGVSQPAVSIAVKRGAKIAQADRLKLEEN